MVIARYSVVSTFGETVTVVTRESSERLDRQGKHVADAAVGLNDLRCAWIGLQLAP